MGIVECGIGLFSLGAYAYAMYVLPLCATAFLVNLSHKYPSLEAYFPYNVDSATPTDPETMNDAAQSNAFYLGVWAVAHSLLARPATKKVFRSVFPESLERPFYVFQSAYLLHLVLKKWVPINDVIYAFPTCVHTTLYACYVFGFLWLLTSTFAIDHFELFGLRQGMSMGNFLRFVPDGFVTVGHYRLCRHPIMTGFFIMFWAVPVMTLGHLFFSAIATTYIVMAVHFLEEPDLIDMMGPEYVAYMESTPSFCPFTRGKEKDKSN